MTPMENDSRAERAARALTTADLEKANLPEKYWKGILFRNIPPTAPYRKAVGRYLERIQEWVDKGYGLYLWSPTNGTGKTAISTMVLMRALQFGYSGYYIRTQALKDLTVENTSYDAARTVMGRIREVDVLVLDDFGKEYRTNSGFVESLVEDLVRERVQRGKVTVFTANLDPDDIEKRFSRDLDEALKEAALMVEVVGEKKGGKDWREAKNEAMYNDFLNE